MAGRGSNRHVRRASYPRYLRGFYRPYRQPYPSRFLEPQVPSTEGDGDLPKNGPAQNGSAKAETRGPAEIKLLPKSVESKLASQALVKQSTNPLAASPGPVSVSKQATGDLPKEGPVKKQQLAKSVESKRANGDLLKEGPVKKQQPAESVESKVAAQAHREQAKSPLTEAPGPVSVSKQPAKSADGKLPKNGPAQKKSPPAQIHSPAAEKQVAEPVIPAENHAVAVKEGRQATESPTSSIPQQPSSKIEVKPRGGGLVSLPPNVSADNVRETMDLHIDCIPPKMTEQQLVDLFKAVGKVAECRMARKGSIMGFGKDHLGFGFLTYIRPADAMKAIEVFDNHVVDGHSLKVSYAKPYGHASLNGNVFVKGFPKSWTANDLRGLFSPYGEIVGARILLDHETGISRGVGFIRFRYVGDAHRAVERLRFTYVQDEPNPLIVRLDQGPKGRDFAQRGYLMPNPYPMMQLPMGAPPFIPQFPWPLLTNGTGLYVAGLPWKAQEKDIWALFGPFGAVQKVEIVRHRATGKSKGYAFVVMSRLHEAEAAMRLLHGSVFQGRRLTVAPKHGEKIPAPFSGMKPSGNGWRAGM